MVEATTLQSTLLSAVPRTVIDFIHTQLILKLPVDFRRVTFLTWSLQHGRRYLWLVSLWQRVWTLLSADCPVTHLSLVVTSTRNRSCVTISLKSDDIYVTERPTAAP